MLSCLHFHAEILFKLIACMKKKLDAGFEQSSITVGHNHKADLKLGKQEYFPNLFDYLVCHSDENKRGLSKDERRQGVVRMIELPWRTWGKKKDDWGLCKEIQVLLTKMMRTIMSVMAEVKQHQQ